MIDDAEPSELYSSRVVARSRRARQCDECQRAIAKGERYRSSSMLYDGRWDTFDTCQHCMSAQEWLIAQCGGYLHGGVQEDLEGHLSEWIKGSHVTLLRLIVGMRRQWRMVTKPDVLMAVRAA